MNYFNLIAYSAEYDSFEQANQHGAVYRTSSTIDSINSSSGLLEIEETISMILTAIGLDKDDLIVGILDNNRFVLLSEVSESNAIL